MLGPKPQGVHSKIAADPDGNHFLQISTSDSFYAIGVRREFEAKHHPFLSWRWRVHRFPANANIGDKKGDDAAARVYVLFSRQDFFHPLATTTALVYVWDDSHPIGSMLPNPYAADREKVIVLESGSQPRDTWLTEHVDFYKDYRRAFGERPADVIAIAFAADSDNTHSSTLSDFDDLLVDSVPQH